MAKQLTTYELAVLYNCNFEDVLEQTKAKINDLIIAHGGQIIEEDIWSKRKLAYPIKKQTQAIYVFYQIEVDGQKLTQIRNQLNVLEEVFALPVL